MGVAVRPIFARVVSGLRNHRALTHVSAVAAALAVALVVSLQGATAGPTPPPVKPVSILPEQIGAGLVSTRSVLLEFAEPMDPTSVTEALTLRPSTAWRSSWSEDGRTLRLIPDSRWRTDARYVVTIDASARLAGGAELGTARQFTFTTETAPLVSSFELYFAEESLTDRVRRAATTEADLASGTADYAVTPPDTSSDVSARTRIVIGFSTPMRQLDVERRFTITPTVAGELSWEGNELVFEPAERLEPGTRYAVSVVGARDERGNRLGGDPSFSFITRAGAQVVKVSPADGAKDVVDGQAQIWFSQPMNIEATRAALKITDATSGATVTGKSAWNAAGTQVRFTFDPALAKGHTFEMSLGDGASDADGNPVSGSWTFQTKAPPAPLVRNTTAPRPAQPAGPAAPADSLQFALWQINQSRAQYGFAPLVLDSAISAVANAHAWDMLNYGYFSHTGRDGSRAADRMRRAGISFSWSGENLCYHAGIGLRATLEWCHATFMSEPYPGYANHIANILNPNFSRVGIGIAQSGGKIYVVWNFAG